VNRHRRLKASNPIALAIRGASKLADHERARILQPVRIAFGKLREGTATEGDWATLASACNVAMAIELQGVVKGLREHLHSTELALASINKRAQDDEGRYPYALHIAEIEQLETFVTVHAFQLSELCRSEYNKACSYAVAEVASSGGRVLQEAPTRQGALQL
jgi:hypothetical protein